MRKPSSPSKTLVSLLMSMMSKISLKVIIFLATCVNAFEWYEDIFNYLKNGIIPVEFDHNARIRINKIVVKYVIIGDFMYRRSFEGTLLRCLM